MHAYAGFSLRMLVAKKGVTVQGDIVKEAPHLNEIVIGCHTLAREFCIYVVNREFSNLQCLMNT